MGEVNWKVDNGLVKIGLANYREMVKHMNSVDPKIARDMKKEFRRIAKPGAVLVASAVPNNAPIRGMIPKAIPGRVTWGTVIPADKTGVETRAPRRRGAKTTSIARIRVSSPATVIADMAGTARKFDRRKRTRDYLYTGPQKGKPAGYIGVRNHAVNGQGRVMVKALNVWRNNGRKSRFIYPAFDRAAPAIRREAVVVIQHAVNKLNAEVGQ